MKEQEIRDKELFLISKQKISIQENEKMISQIRETGKSPFEVTELKTMRDASKRVVRMSDGTTKAFFYPNRTYFLNENQNEYEEIDHTLISEQGGQYFKNVNGTFVARFSKDAETDEIFSIEQKKHKITVYSRKNKNNLNHRMTATLQNNITEKMSQGEMVSFQGFIEGSDLEYSIIDDGVKEDIVIHKKSAMYRYPFVLKCENVVVEYKEREKQIAFKDSTNGDLVFVIPAPFMIDANGSISTDVSYEVRNLATDKIAFTIIADSDWVNADDRAFPVTIDPQIRVQGSQTMTTYSWYDGTLYTTASHTVGTTGMGDGTCNAKRMYLNFTMPVLPRNPRIKKAELILKQVDAQCQGNLLPKIGLYYVSDELCLGCCTPIHTGNLIDFVQMKTESGTSYSFDITTILDQMIKGEAIHTNFVLKMIDEVNTANNYVTLAGSTNTSGGYKPVISITYENSYGVNASYRMHSHDIGSFGQGSIDLQCGNLMIES